MLYLSLSDGEVEVHYNADIRRFTNPDEAAEYIADMAVKTGTMEFLHSSSYYYPEENGFEDFDHDKFEDTIYQKFLRKLN